MDGRKLHKLYKETLNGQVFTTKRYGKVVIIKYYNSAHVQIEFIETGTLSSANLENIRDGVVYDPFAKGKTHFVLGNGYPGKGEFRKTTHKAAYDKWFSMLSRCYDSKVQTNSPAYKDCYVCEEWLNFQEFAAWYYSQNVESDYALDKDIIIKGNKVYAPDRCALVPRKINNLFEKRRALRGIFPIGIYHAPYCKNNPFVASCNDGNGKNKHLGCFKSPEEAFLAYKKFKEALIKKMASEYKDKLILRVYEAMMNYQVEITD